MTTRNLPHRPFNSLLFFQFVVIIFNYFSLFSILCYFQSFVIIFNSSSLFSILCHYLSHYLLPKRVVSHSGTHPLVLSCSKVRITLILQHTARLHFVLQMLSGSTYMNVQLSIHAQCVRGRGSYRIGSS